MGVRAAPPRIVDRAARGLERLTWLPALLTRIVIGLAFVQTGIGKWAHMDRTIEFFADLGLPAPAANAILVASLEVVGGSALIAGLFTRFFGALLSMTMVVALLTADRQAFIASWSRSGESSPTDVTSFVFLLLLLWLVFSGAGGASLDRLLRSVFRESRQGSATPR